MWAPFRELNPTRWAVTNNRSEEKRISWVKECYALCHFLSALIWFHGPDKYHGEKEDIERERVSAVGIKAKKPWELFTDTSLRWQLLTLVVIHTSQQLNGINAVCISPRQQETTASHQWLILALTADVCTINTQKKKNSLQNGMWSLCCGLTLIFSQSKLLLKKKKILALRLWHLLELL